MNTLEILEVNAVARSASSIFKPIRKNSFISNDENIPLRDLFTLLIRGKGNLHGPFGTISRVGEVKKRSRMVINGTRSQTLASITWSENNKTFAAYFFLEDEFPLPSSIIDLSNALR